MESKLKRIIQRTINESQLLTENVPCPIVNCNGCTDCCHAKDDRRVYWGCPEGETCDNKSHGNRGGQCIKDTMTKGGGDYYEDDYALSSDDYDYDYDDELPIRYSRERGINESKLLLERNTCWHRIKKRSSGKWSCGRHKCGTGDWNIPGHRNEYGKRFDCMGRSTPASTTGGNNDYDNWEMDQERERAIGICQDDSDCYGGGKCGPLNDKGYGTCGDAEFNQGFLRESTFKRLVKKVITEKEGCRGWFDCPNGRCLRNNQKASCTKDGKEINTSDGGGECGCKDYDKVDGLTYVAGVGHIREQASIIKEMKTCWVGNGKGRDRSCFACGANEPGRRKQRCDEYISEQGCNTYTECMDGKVGYTPTTGNPYDVDIERYSDDRLA